jgi:hypothetical protein
MPTCKYLVLFTMSATASQYVCAVTGSKIELSICTNCPNYREQPVTLEVGTVTTTVTRSIPKELLQGPGTSLHKAIQAYFGEGAETDCSCGEHILQMNKWGYEGCVENIDTITSWLMNEAIKRKWKSVKLPLARYAIKQFILHTIKE